eukprot:jgi/Ulvmu1/12631/UM093_0024.1
MCYNMLDAGNASHAFPASTKYLFPQHDRTKHTLKHDHCSLADNIVYDHGHHCAPSNDLIIRRPGSELPQIVHSACQSKLVGGAIAPDCLHSRQPALLCSHAS